MKKRVISSITLLAVAAVSVVALMNKSGDEKIHANMKVAAAASTFCGSTEYKDVCEKVLGSLNSPDPKEAVKHAIQAAQEAVKKFFNSTETWVKEAKDGTDTKMALEDCRDVMDLAVDSLQAAFSSVGDPQMHNITARINDLRTFLSSVISYKSSCGDAFKDDDSMKSKVTGDMEEGRKLTSNALAIVSSLSNALGELGLQLNIPTSGRKLMTYGFPDWFSGHDRKMLTKIDNSKLKPNAVVAKDGSGQFKTIMAALGAAPKNSKTRHIIYVKAGVYNEHVMVDKTLTNILMYGDGPRKTIVTGDKNFEIQHVKTQDTATFTVVGTGFIGRSMGFSNTAGPPGHQAVALRVASDKSVFFNCRMDGFQDTLYTHAGRQYYRNCVISGTVDFIFGDAAAMIQSSLIIVRKCMDNQFNAITAQGKSDKNENTAIVIQNCRIVPDQALAAARFKIKTYLGRPWKPFATTVYMENQLGDLIQPQGWKEWEGTKHLDTLYYAEFANRGPGANTAQRVNWPGYKRSKLRAPAPPEYRLVPHYHHHSSEYPEEYYSEYPEVGSGYEYYEDEPTPGDDAL